MLQKTRTGSFALAILACVAALSLLSRNVCAQAEAPTEALASTNAVNPLSEELARISAAQLQTLLLIQTQQQASFKALELTRQEIAVSLAASASNNMAHLDAMAEMLGRQRAQDLKIIRDSSRLALAIVVGLSGLLLLSIIFLNVTSIRAINRLSTYFSASALLPGAEAQQLADAREGSKQLVLFPGEEGQRQLGHALLQLQGRIQNLERLASRLQPGPGPASSPPASPAVAAKADSAAPSLAR